MSVEEVAPQLELAALLPGAQFMDAYCLELDGQTSMRAKRRYG
jgi:hypothetical protein